MLYVTFVFLEIKNIKLIRNRLEGIIEKDRDGPNKGAAHKIHQL
jgi:hypothetical protein